MNNFCEMHFMSDRLTDGRVFWILTIVNCHKRGSSHLREGEPTGPTGHRRTLSHRPAQG
jgi:hypothetical protein